MSFSIMNFRRNNDSEKNVVRHYELSVIRRFSYVTIRSNYVRWCFFFRRDNDSVKWRFGKTTIRSNDVSAKSCGPDCVEYFKNMCMFLYVQIKKKNLSVVSDVRMLGIHTAATRTSRIARDFHSWSTNRIGARKFIASSSCKEEEED